MRVSLIFALVLALAACGKKADAPPAALPDAELDAPSLKPFECGIASFYHPRLDGRATASGETYDEAEMTAAHKDLPFDTQVQVTRRDTGQSVVVRINDRGPFVAGRAIDLSRAAGEKLGLVGEDGVAEVCIRQL